MTRPPLRILIVDDDPDIASVLCRGLALEGFETATEARADAAFTRLADAPFDPPFDTPFDTPFDAAIVDVMIGDESGLDLVRKLRRSSIRLPVIMLSALIGIDDRTEGLRAGADDYVIKPFSLDELTARLRVQIARATERATPTLALDPQNRTACAGDHRAELTEREFALLSLLLRHRGETLSRGEIFDALWTGDGPGAENVVDVYVGYLRRKLSPAQNFGMEIVTIRSRGFQLRDIAP
jgi:DNA-binding response OmpR family regulator